MKILLLLLISSTSYGLTVKSGEVKVLQSSSLVSEEVVVEKGAELIIPSSCSWFVLKTKKMILDGTITARDCNSPYHKESYDGFTYEVKSSSGGNGKPSSIEGTVLYEGGKSLFGHGGSGGSFDVSGEDSSWGYPGRSLGIGGGGGVRGNHGQALFLEVETWSGSGVIDVRGKEGSSGSKGSFKKTKVLKKTLTKELCVEPTSKGVCSHVEKRYTQKEEEVTVLGGDGGAGSGGSGGVVVFTKGFKGKVLVDGFDGRKGRVYEK